MIEKFNIGDRVQWLSQALGRSRVKVGEIAEVLEAGWLPDRDRFPHLYRSAGVGMQRNHESYVVMVGKRPYWPRVKHLKPASPDRRRA